MVFAELTTPAFSLPVNSRNVPATPKVHFKSMSKTCHLNFGHRWILLKLDEVIYPSLNNDF